MRNHLIRFVLFSVIGIGVAALWQHIVLLYGVWHGVAFIGLILGAFITFIYKMIEG